MESFRTLKIARNGYIVSSVCFCALGIWLILEPSVAAELLCLLIGALFTFYGIIKIIGYCAKDFYCLAFQFDLALGLLMGAVGVIIIVRRGALEHMILTIFGLLLLADSLFRIQICIDAKRFGLDLWWKIMVVALAAGTLGALLLIIPSKGAGFMLPLTGAAMVAEGILNLMIVIFTVKILETC